MRFGFWIDGNTLEYALAASGKLTIKKFDEMFYKLENEYPVKDVSDKPNIIRKEIQVDGMREVCSRNQAERMT